MSRYLHGFLGMAAVGVMLVVVSAEPARAAQPPIKTFQPKVSPNTRPGNNMKVYPPDRKTGPIGGDWWRTYPWSPYNAWKNPYWYPPYNTHYPFPPHQAYPYYPYPVPLPYPV